MKIKQAIFTLSASVVVCHTQAINISGVVKNSAGSGLEGVKVRLGKAAIMTTTAANGSFTLTDVTGLKHQPHRTAFSDNCPFLLEGNRFSFSGGEQSGATVTIYDCKGRLAACAAGPAVRGGVSMTIPPVAGGVHIYRILIDNKNYTFRHLAGMTANRAPTSSWKATGHVKQAKATVQMDDAILFIKAGYQYYRIAMKKPDTSGLQITMTPLDTGTVTDYEGNVYKTVRIGNQYWTAENLRSTKYTDGSNIGSGCLFYNNTTDAAAKKKWGALYNDAVVKSGKLAPTGWRIPTNADWDTLLNYLISHGYNYDGTTKDDKIAKSMAATTDWDTVSEPGAIGNDLSLNNASGFSALPAGWRFWDNKFEKLYSGAYWWIAGSGSANVLDLWWISMGLDRYSTIYVFCSVRLVRNI